MGRAGKKRAQRRRKSRRRLWLPLTLLGGALLAALYFGLLWPFWQLTGQFSERPILQPSRLFGRPPLIESEAPLSRERLARRLAERGYRRVEKPELGPGEFRLEPGAPPLLPRLEVQLRSFPTPLGLSPPARLVVSFSGRFVKSVERDGERVPSAWLEAPLLTSYYGPELKERRPVRLSEAPEHLVRAVLAAEDASFFSHSGLSLRGIVRASWANMRGGGVRQGGSTLTQQLVKNLFLTHERTWMRKSREVILALLLDWRYSKEEILQAYLNEVYWGRSGRVNLMGVGAAAWAYFGKEPGELDVAESAILAGMLRSPGHNSPIDHPEAARSRRNSVLERMSELGWLESEDLEPLLASPVVVAPQPLDLGIARYAADAVAAEARERFGIGQLEDRGYVLFSTLRLDDQREAEESVAWGLDRLSSSKESGGGGLQAVLVSVDPRSGSILAYVGGRDYGQSQFDRARFARRQPGSAFKSIVYLAAFADRVASPATLLDDSPLTVDGGGGQQSWSPRNSDGLHRGLVTARRALEESLNVPTVRLAREVGQRRVVDWARALGIESRLEPIPSLALGVFEVTPLELLGVYSTLAAEGRRTSLHGLDTLFDRDGRMLEGRPLDPPRQVVAAEVAYVTTSVLQGVLDRGTARTATLSDALAGKTGTSNDRRDSWFVGYSPERATLVWVGYDDGSPTRLSGARAALPIWNRFTEERRPPLGYSAFLPPPGVTTVTIDPASGGRATGRCPEVFTEVFLFDQVPTEDCILHGRGRRFRREEDGKSDRRRWLDRIFRRRPSQDRPVT